MLGRRRVPRRRRPRAVRPATGTAAVERGQHEHGEGRPTAVAGREEHGGCLAVDDGNAARGAIRTRFRGEHRGYSRTMRRHPGQVARGARVRCRNVALVDRDTRGWVTGPCPSRTSSCPDGRRRRGRRSSSCTGARPRAGNRSTAGQLTVRRMHPFARDLAALGDDLAVAQLRYRIRGWNDTGVDAARRRRASRSTALDAALRRRAHRARRPLDGRARPRCDAAGHPTVRGVVALAPWLPGTEPVEQLAGRDLVVLHGTRDLTTSPRASARLRRPGRAPFARRAVCLQVPWSGHGMLLRARRPGTGSPPRSSPPSSTTRRSTAARPRPCRAAARRHRRARRDGGRIVSVRHTPAPAGRGRRRGCCGPHRRLRAAARAATSPSTRRSPVSAGTRTPTTSSPPTAASCPIDSGFIVHNLSTYPNLLRLFGELGVETQPTDMSMSVRCDGCGLEYAGAKGLGGIFAQAANAANPRFLRMLVEVKRFHRAAQQLLDDTSRRRRADGPARWAAHPGRLPRRRAATRRTSAGTSWCRWSRACGRARRAPRCCTRRARCSPSSTTTAR